METLDLRSLPCPEPFERVLDEVEARPAGSTFAVLVPTEPLPLYGFLQKYGCTWSGEVLPDGYKLIISTPS